MKNLENKLQILNENKGENSLFDYVTTASENDPNFYRWLFDEDFENDFDKSLTESQKREFQNWLSEIELEDKFEKYIVIKKDEENPSYYITKRNNFENVKLCDCYKNYGQKIDCYDAGCYTIENSGSNAKNDCIEALYKNFNIDFDKDNLTDENFDLAIEGENELLSNIELSEILSFIEKWDGYNENHTSATAWTYWDGNNHKTLCLATDFGNPDCEELDEEESKQILKEFNGAARIDSGVAASYSGEKYTFTSSLWVTDPFICSVEIN